MIEITKRELITRTCHCGVTFRCLETSPQKYHALSCTPMDERAYDWRSTKQKGQARAKMLRTVPRDESWTTETSETNGLVSAIKNERTIPLSALNVDSRQQNNERENPSPQNKSLSAENQLNGGEKKLDSRTPTSTEDPVDTIKNITNEPGTSAKPQNGDGWQPSSKTQTNSENMKKNVGDTMNSIENEEQFDIESGLSRIEEEYDNSRQLTEKETEIKLEKNKTLTTIENTHQQRSQTHSTKLQQVSYQSQNLVNESIGQLKELMKLSVATLWSQDVKARDPNMLNAGVNAAKAISTLLKLKLEAAQLK